MNSEDVYPRESRLALRAMQFQAEDSLAQSGPPDRKPPARPLHRQAFTPDQREYKAKGVIRSLAAMLSADEDEI